MTSVDFERRPRVAIWEVTRACDLKCLHCRACAMAERDPHELSTAEAVALIAQLRDLDPDVVVLTGGDPLKRPDLPDLIARAADAGLRLALAPSVTPLLTAEAIERLVRAGIGRIALSLDGGDALIHDGLRGVPGSYDATLIAMAAVTDAGIPLQINSTLTPATLPELPATGALVARLAPTLWSVFFVVPVGRAAAARQLDAYAAEAAFHYLYDWGERTKLPVKTTAAPAYRRIVRERDAARRRAGDVTPRQRPQPSAVNDGKGFVFVSHTGEVQPSGFLPIRVGNVRASPLATIYRDNPVLRALRCESLLQGRCGVCPFRTLCGGSRARAYATTGNLFAEDPACLYRPPKLDAAA